MNSPNLVLILFVLQLIPHVLFNPLSLTLLTLLSFILFPSKFLPSQNQILQVLVLSLLHMLHAFAANILFSSQFCLLQLLLQPFNFGLVLDDGVDEVLFDGEEPGDDEFYGCRDIFEMEEIYLTVEFYIMSELHESLILSSL